MTFKNCFGDINQVWPTNESTAQELSNVFPELQGDKGLNLSKQLSLEAEQELTLIEKVL